MIDSPNASDSRGQSTAGALPAAPVTSWPLLLHPMLAAVLPVLMLWAGNVTEVVPATGLRVTALGLAAGSVLYLLIGVGLRRPWPTAALVTTPTILVLWWGNQLPDAAPPTVAVGVSIVLPLIFLWGATTLGPIARRRASLLLSVALLAATVANAAVIIARMPSSVVSQVDVNRTNGSRMSEAAQRDVWLIVPDRYASPPVLARRGIDATDMTNALKARGFDVLDRATANYPQTVLSLASAFNFELTDVAGQGSRDLVVTAAHKLDEHELGSTMQQAGYEYLHLGSWADFTAEPAIADTVLTLPGGGEFRNTWLSTTALGAALELTGRGLQDMQRQQRHASHQLDVLSTLADRSDDANRFVLAHLILPHGPYVYRADGSPQSPDVDPDDGYDDQRRYLDDQLLGLIDMLQDNDRPPIIVIASDEGLYPRAWVGTEQRDYDWSTASVDEARDKLGILVAVYDPAPTGDTTITLRDDSSLVNVTRWLANRAAGTSYPELPDDHWLYRGTGPNDLQLVDLDETSLD